MALGGPEESKTHHCLHKYEEMTRHSVPQIVIRRMREDETESHKQLLDTAFAPLRAVYRKTTRPSRSPSRTSRAIVADWDERLVGAVSYYFQDRQVRLFALAVHPDFRHRGVARALIEWVAGNVCSKGHPVLGLYTIEETGNVPFFERLGFHTVSRRVAVDAASPSGGPVHEVEMVWGITKPFRE